MVIPMTAEELIKQLDAAYPDACPNIKDTDREIWIKAGQRNVVQTLLTSLKQQEEEE